MTWVADSLTLILPLGTLVSRRLLAKTCQQRLLPPDVLSIATKQLQPGSDGASEADGSADQPLPIFGDELLTAVVGIDGHPDVAF